MESKNSPTTLSRVMPDSENIRILPESIVFDDPFEGKCFETEIVLQNVGPTPKLIRIMDPTSSNIKMKTAKEGIFLPSGMKIKRKITYTVVMATLVESFVIPIFINTTYIPYHCEVKIVKNIFEIIPPTIDFGVIDAGPMTSKRTMQILNNGLKPSRFAIDLGLNELNIQVEPIKGIIMESSSVVITIELNASLEGTFETEFWVISNAPTCVKLYVKVIKGILECVHQNAMKSFTFIRFPHIYYGTKSLKSVLLRNRSQLPSLFCITGESNFKSMHLSDISKIDPDYNHFHISPVDGRLPSNDRRPFLLIFEPTLDKCHQRYRTIIVTIHKILCSDIGLLSCKKEEIFRGCEEYVSKDLLRGSVSSVSSEKYILNSDFLEEDVSESKFQPQDELYYHLKLILLGETEQPSLSILPDELFLRDPIVGEAITRTLVLTNNSTNLPIYYKYVKIAFVEVKPQMGFLKARESKEVLLTITPESCTDVNEFIKFELLYHDIPRVIDFKLKVIGSKQIPVSFQAVFPKKPKKCDFITANTYPFDKPNTKPDGYILSCLKNESAILALPDDRPLSLKTWKDPRRCRTIYAAIPRLIETTDDDYMLSKSEAALKKLTQSYYQQYLQRSVVVKPSDASSLSLSIAKHYETRCVVKKPKKRDEVIRADFLPLTPIQLYNIEIDPKDAFVEGVMARSSFLNSIRVTNKNEDAIRIYIRPQKLHSFFFPNGHRMVIGPKKTETHTYLFFTEASGIRTHMIDVIVNENHVFCASLTVKVSPAMLEFSTTDIIYHPKDSPYKYIQMTNKLNASISFSWDFTGDLTIYPLEGCIYPEQSLTCTIYYEASRCASNNYELQIRIDNKRMKVVRVRINKNQFKVDFVNEVNFETVGKDSPNSISAKLENKSIDDVPFSFDVSKLEEGITINPQSGTLPKTSFLMITFTLNRSIIGPFTCETTLTYARFYFKTIKITGTCIYPKVVFSSDIIRFRKMAASSFDIKCFTVQNISHVAAAINFDVDRYPEIHLSEYVDSKFLEETDIINIPPKSQKVFSIHLYPFYATSTSFYLPVRVNGLDNKSCPSIKFHYHTLSHRILIDSWRYKFTYFPYYDYKSHTEEEIVMKVKDYTKLCIRLDELEKPFSFEHISGGTETKYPCSLVYELEAEEELVFKVMFKPEITGNFVMKLPVYIRDDVSEDMHNYLYIQGDYPVMTMEFDPNPIHFGFVPHNYEVSKNVVVTLKNHKPDCCVDTFVDDCNISIEKHSPVLATHCKFQARIHFSAPEVHMVDTYIKFSCSCGHTAKLRCIGGAENCILTIYSFVMYYEIIYDLPPNRLFANVQAVESRSSLAASHQDINLTPSVLPPLITSFPYFPTEDDDFTKYMETLVVNIEKWLNEQIFHKNVYYKIPDSICICEIRTPSKSGRKDDEPKPYCYIPLLYVLKYYCGPNVTDFINTEYHKDINFPEWIHGIYYSMINFLVQMGAMLPHIEPEYLLDYDNYRNYMTKKEAGKEILSPSKFYLLSKQCWLDMCLQTYKTLEYQRIATYASVKASCNLRRNMMTNILDELRQSRSGDRISMNIYSYECAVLLTWLNKTLAEQKRIMTSREYSINSSYDNIKNKTIQNFGADLTDCLAFCAATIRYCPYLSRCLHGIYVPPTTRHEAFHNASVLIKVWKMLDISFTLIPTDLIEINPVLMQFFTAYMYEFLLHMVPTDTIHFSTQLGNKFSEYVTVGNANDVTIEFNVKIFNNVGGTFSSDPSICIKSGFAEKLKVTYFAKFIKPQTATLLLNGEIYSSRYFANSKVFTLVGVPQIGPPTLELTFNSCIYKQHDITADIQSPYHKAATYELFCTSKEPTCLDTLNLVPYKAFHKSSKLARTYINDYIFNSSEDGLIFLSGDICAITNSNIKYWMFFKSAIGDFYVSVDSTTKPNAKDVVPLYVDLGNVMSSVCKCRHEPDIENITCPRNVKISIPAINQSLWRTVIALYTRDADEKEKKFWLKYQDTEIGPVLLKKILEQLKQDVTSGLAHLFKENITFDISASSNQFKHAPKIQINTASGTVDTVIHINSISKKLIMVLNSDDRCETRTYEIVM